MQKVLVLVVERAIKRGEVLEREVHDLVDGAVVHILHHVADVHRQHVDLIDLVAIHEGIARTLAQSREGLDRVLNRENVAAHRWHHTRSLDVVVGRACMSAHTAKELVTVNAHEQRIRIQALRNGRLNLHGHDDRLVRRHHVVALKPRPLITVCGVQVHDRTHRIHCAADRLPGLRFGEQPKHDWIDLTDLVHVVQVALRGQLDVLPHDLVAIQLPTIGSQTCKLVIVLLFLGRRAPHIAQRVIDQVVKSHTRSRCENKTWSRAFRHPPQARCR